ncbi:TraB/GumN family protein [Phenylobacterium sp.]|jgi:uncharacterized protein YbaP (TraB family)|uniref:TraB/GumN family protein n=1 Tax=Phenylobacterium sp. TaxID=1871053 RepID=UPI002F942587
MTRPFLALIIAVFTASGAQAQQPLPDPEAAIVEELVVQAREPGPAWWRVVDADTTVWILAVGEDSIPADIAWDRRALERRLTGANSVIVGTRIGLTGGLRDIPALLRARSQLKSKAPMEETLPPALRARFVAARERIGQPARKYAGWQPILAGGQLISDSQRTESTASVTKAILAQAKRRKVKVVDPARYDAIPFMRKALGSLTPDLQHRCLDSAIRDAEAPAARRRAAAQGWARGDVAAALGEPRNYDSCVLLLGGGAELWRRARDDRMAAIVEAMKAPGHSVALIGLRALLAQEGVIQELEAKGFKVLGPGEAE